MNAQFLLSLDLKLALGMHAFCDFVLFQLFLVGGDASVSSLLSPARNVFTREGDLPPSLCENGSTSDLLEVTKENNGTDGSVYFFVSFLAYGYFTCFYIRFLLSCLFEISVSCTRGGKCMVILLQVGQSCHLRWHLLILLQVGICVIVSFIIPTFIGKHSVISEKCYSLSGASNNRSMLISVASMILCLIFSILLLFSVMTILSKILKLSCFF